jgi:hypothetical protein
MHHHQQQQQHHQQQHQQQQQRKSLCFEDVQFRHPHLMNASAHHHTLASPADRGSTGKPGGGGPMSYTTLPRNLNAAQPRSAIKLVPFRPINNGLPTHEGNELQMVSNK